MTENHWDGIETKTQNSYNHSMLSLNIKNKHYICVPQIEGLVDNFSYSRKIYIGSKWKDILFPENPPLLTADDFSHFIKKVNEEHGGMKQLFESENGKAIKVYVDHDSMVPFFLYFLIQIDQVFHLGDAVIKDILKKTNERFWIWDNKHLGLSLELYQVFKEQNGNIPEKDLIFSLDDILSLPFEYILLLYAHEKITKQGLLKKLETLKSYLVGMSVIQVKRSGLETLLNDRRVLLSYNGTDITAHDDIIPILEQDDLMSGLFFRGIDTKDASWIESRLDKLKSFMALLKTYDLDSHDPFPSYDEFNKIQQLFYGQNQEEILDEFLGPKGLNFHELDFFKEYHNKMNTTLINYVSVKLSREGQVANE